MGTSNKQHNGGQPPTPADLGINEARYADVRRVRGGIQFSVGP